MRLLGLAAAVLLVFLNWACAAPLDLKQVSADARWLVLVDVDGIRTATGWRQVHEQFWAGIEPALGPILKGLGLNLKDGLHGATIYATQLASKKNPEDFRGAAIVSVDLDQEKLVEKLKALAGYKSAAHGSCLIHRWEASVDGDSKQAACIAFHPSKLVVVSISIDDAKRALDVLDGKATNITQTDSSLATAVPVGTLLLVRGLDLEKVAAQFESPLLRQSESLSLAIGEQDKQAFADGQARLKSIDTAQQVEALVNGFRALLQLQAGSQDEVAKMLGRIQCVRSDKVVSLSLRLPTDDLQAMLKNAGGIAVKTQASASVRVENSLPEGVRPKPGVGFKYKVGMEFGTEPPADKLPKPSPKSQPEDK